VHFLMIVSSLRMQHKIIFCSQDIW